MTRIAIDGLDLYAYHGVPDAEQTVGHRYRIDLVLEVDESAHLSDDVSDTVDYGEIGLLVTRIATTRQFRTIERLAYVLGQEVLAQSPRIASVEITVAKPLPPAPVLAEAVSVTLTVER